MAQKKTTGVARLLPRSNVSRTVEKEVPALVPNAAAGSGTVASDALIGGDGVAAVSATVERFASVPQALRALPRWLLWRYGPLKPDGTRSKLPFYVNGSRRKGEQGSAGDLSMLAAFDVVSKVEASGWDGIGIAMVRGDHLVALDFDHKETTVDPLPYEQIATLCSGTYFERSPSGKGYRAFYVGDMRKITKGPRGIEVFPHGQFVTVTGELDPLASITVAPLADAVRDQIYELAGEPPVDLRDDGKSAPKPSLGISLDEARDVLDHLPPESVDDYWEWLYGGMALHHEFGGSDDALALWDEWSARGSKHSPGECAGKWRTFGKPGKTMVYLVRQAERTGWRMPATIAQAVADFEKQQPMPKDDGIRFRLVTGTEIMNRQKSDEVPAILGVACPVGVVMLAGKGGGGKSTIAASLAAPVTNGKACPPWEARTVLRKPAAVLWLTVEEDLEGMVLPRHKALGGDTDLIVVPEIERLQDANGNWLAREFDVEKDLRSLLQSRSEAGTPIKLVVCDSLPGLVQWGRRNTNSDTDVKKMLNVLSQIVFEFGACLLGIAHWNKNTDRGEDYRISGAQAWRETPRLSFTCEPGYIYVNKGNDIVDFGCTFEQQVVKVLREIEVESEDGRPMQITARRAVFGQYLLSKERVLELKKMAAADAADVEKIGKQALPTVSRLDRMCTIARECFDLIGWGPLYASSVWRDVGREYGSEVNSKEKIEVRERLGLKTEKVGKHEMLSIDDSH